MKGSKRRAAALAAGLLLMMAPAGAAETAWEEIPNANIPAAVIAREVAEAGGMQAELSLPVKSAILIDQNTGTVRYEKNADQPLPPASITKIMSLLLFMEALESGKIGLQDTVTCSEVAAGFGGSQIWLKPGEEMTVEELLKAVAVQSANDATVCLAEYVAGSETAFVQQMNQKAAELGMEHTHFACCAGLDHEDHYSTARDIALMSRALLQYPKITEYTTIWMDTLRGGATSLVNTNRLVRFYQGATGLKTGTTNGAGCCLSASATRDGLTLIAVVLGSPSSADRFHSATTLLDYGFANYAAAPLPTLPERPLALAVKGSAEDSVPLDYAALPETILIEKGTASALRAELTLPEELEAPVEKGQTVGKVSIFQDDTLLNEYEVKAAADAPLLTFGGALELLWQCLLGA